MGVLQCTKDVFSTVQLSDDPMDTFFGVVAFEDFGVHAGILEAGGIGFLPLGFNARQPAIYECCVGNKSYRPQTYVLGSPHKSKKEIVHVQSPYIP